MALTSSKWTRFCHQWVLFTCQFVTLSLSFCCFTKPSHLLTQTRGFCMLAHSARGPGEWIPLEIVCLWVQILPWKFQPISSTFTPSKSHISVLLGVAPSPGGLLLSTLAPKWAALTLTCVLNIVSQYHSYTFQNKIPLQHVSEQCKRCRHARRNCLQPGLYLSRSPPVYFALDQKIPWLSPVKFKTITQNTTVMFWCDYVTFLRGCAV